MEIQAYTERRKEICGPILHKTTQIDGEDY